MNYKRVIPILLAASMLIPSTALAADEAPIVSDWAQKEVNIAKELGLLSDRLGGNYKQDITRYQFAGLAVSFVEQETGKSIEPLGTDSFADTSDTMVLKAAAAGITTGTGKDAFQPDAFITREEVSTMLYRAINYIDAGALSAPAALDSYTDAKDVADWAAQAMGSMVAEQIIQGTTSAALATKEPTSIEQALILTVRATATLEGNEWLAEQLNSASSATQDSFAFLQGLAPAFLDILVPVQASCEDQGIRMELIGANQYGNMAVACLSLHDTTGENRVTENTDFMDGFYVSIGQAAASDTTGYSWTRTLLDFDESTNTAYLEFLITADAGSRLSNTLALGTSLIYFDTLSYELEPIPVAMSDVKTVTGDTIKVSSVISCGASNDGVLPFAFQNDDDRTAILTPGYYAAMPHGYDGQWISNIGVIDGKLHVQIGSYANAEFGGTPQLDLVSAGGEQMTENCWFAFFADADHQIASDRDTAFETAKYRYDEVILPVDQATLSGYTLCFTGTLASGAEGSWQLAAELGDTSGQIRTWTNDIAVEDQLFEHLTLSPLGLEATGSFAGDTLYVASELKLEVETAKGIIQLSGGGGSYDEKAKTFALTWNAASTIDVAQATAILINGTRISIA
ncbi:MAG: S-layer homology domain-containing protein [Oscillospiraceae bacterium]|nr:S-layer homology domain-containing protein [Oscillospiraceae bacterium]